MRTKTLALIAVAVTLGTLIFTRQKTALPSDFRDAIAEGGGEFSTAIPVITENTSKPPIPAVPQKSAQLADVFGQDEDSKPFINVELLSARIGGKTARETRINVETFFGKLGFKIIFYQDNDAIRAAELNPRKSTGMVDSVKLAYIKSQNLKKIKELPEVKNVSCHANDDSCVVFFSRDFLYEQRIREIFSAYPDLTLALPRKNSAMAGQVWIELSTEGMDQPKAVAAKLKKQFPDMIVSSDVMANVVVFEGHSR